MTEPTRASSARGLPQSPPRSRPWEQEPSSHRPSTQTPGPTVQEHPSRPQHADLHKPSQVRRGNQKAGTRGLAWCAVVKNPAANAGDTGSIPGPGGSQVPQSNKGREPQLPNLCSRAREPQPPSPGAAATESRATWSPCSTTRGATARKSLHTATGELGPNACNQRQSLPPPRPSAAKTKPIKLLFLIKEERKKAPEKPLPTKGSHKQLFSDSVPDGLETEIYLCIGVEPLICTVGICRVTVRHPICQSSVSLLQEHLGTRACLGCRRPTPTLGKQQSRDSYNTGRAETGPRWLCAHPYLTEQKCQGKSARKLCL